ncbi:MAG: sulfite reductase flavoprotein subunit alpha [Pseudomonadota bacterium]
MNKPFFPPKAPFNEDQKSWLAGFMAGLKASAEMQGTTAVSAGSQVKAHELNILFGTQTGNAELLAEDTAELAQKAGFATVITALDDVEMDDLATMENVVVVVSTYGEGEMPDNAELFWDAMSSSVAPRLENVNYGILALGDTGYEDFCQAGKLIDTRMEQLGAKRILPRIDCDVDYDDIAIAWVEELLPAIAQELNVQQPDATLTAAPKAGNRKREKWNKKNPYRSQLLENKRLSGPSSAKEIRHFSLSLPADAISYEAGDALGVVPLNKQGLVDAFLQHFDADGDDTADGFEASLEEVLKSQLEIVTPNREFISELSARIKHDELNHVVSNADKETMDAFLWKQDTLDLLRLSPSMPFGIDEFLKLMKPLQHRAYSISSSPKAHVDEVHLTVAAVRWSHLNRQHNGVCSTYLSDDAEIGQVVPVFVSQNKGFRPPQDANAPMIMIGPGTGVAPFRAFLEERREIGASGKNWLFFGDQHRAHDFAYEEEISMMSKSGLLNRLDLAFSRDQKEKIYVQSRMLENGKELFSWLEDGGYFYVCGDATRMARDVDDALHEVIAINGEMSEEDAAEYVTGLKRQKRYLRDVY